MTLDRAENEFTSEWVSRGHPDKIADQISDALLDAYLTKNPQCRTAIETLITSKKIIIAGEVSLDILSKQEIIDTSKSVLKTLNYDSSLLDVENMEVEVLLNAQSEEIAQCVGSCEGAGDQGMMFGFATIETPNYMPAPIYLAQKIIQQVLQQSALGKTKFTLGPDAKSQVTVGYKKGRPHHIKNILLSIQHPFGTSREDVVKETMPIILRNIPTGWIKDLDNIIINPSKQFHVGGPASDCGVTGRKLIVDSYGGYYYNGGGATSGKDCTKADRFGAYITRYIAKNIVAAGIAPACGVNIAYAIGLPQPVSFSINLIGKSKVSKKQIEQFIMDNIDLTPAAIRDRLGLEKPIYYQTASQGHFGHEPGADGSYPWERIDLVETLATKFNLAKAQRNKFYIPGLGMTKSLSA